MSRTLHPDAFETFERAVRDFPIETRVIVYPRRPQSYEAVVIGHTETMLRLKVVTPKERALRGEYVNVKPSNVERVS
jgi:hypothetical protein